MQTRSGTLQHLDMKGCGLGRDAGGLEVGVRDPDPLSGAEHTETDGSAGTVGDRG